MKAYNVLIRVFIQYILSCVTSKIKGIIDTIGTPDITCHQMSTYVTYLSIYQLFYLF